MTRRRGNCYVTCEALYHLLGGKRAGLTPHVVRHEGDVHWYLVQRGTVIDPTRRQFQKRPPYERGRGCGFLTKRPSRRARAMMRAMVWQPALPRRARQTPTPR